MQGVSARIEFTNNLLPSGSLPRDTASPTLTGATGRLWLANDGRLRLELQSSNGDAQIVSDGKQFRSMTRASNPAFPARCPPDAKRRSRRARDARARQAGPRRLDEAVDADRPHGHERSRPSYTVRFAPSTTAA